MNLPPLPEFPANEVIPLSAIRYVPGYTKSFVQEYATAYARAALAAQPGAVGLEALRHSANEWADMATNGLQWVRNIAEGISTPADALANLESNLQHCREVNDAPLVQDTIRRIAAAPTEAKPAQDALDAERYRWVCEQDHKDRQWVDTFAEFKAQSDARIDAAISAKKGGA